MTLRRRKLRPPRRSAELGDYDETQRRERQVEGQLNARFDLDRRVVGEPFEPLPSGDPCQLIGGWVPWAAPGLPRGGGGAVGAGAPGRLGGATPRRGGLPDKGATGRW